MWTIEYSMQTQREIVAALQSIGPVLRERFGVSSISVFGSVARGDYGPASDVDVLVEFDRPATLITLASIRLALMERLGREVDVGTWASLRPSMRARVMGEALRVA